MCLNAIARTFMAISLKDEAKSSQISLVRLNHPLNLAIALVTVCFVSIPKGGDICETPSRSVQCVPPADSIATAPFVFQQHKRGSSTKLGHGMGCEASYDWLTVIRYESRLARERTYREKGGFERYYWLLWP